MNLLPKSAWRYALLMVILLGAVALASYSIIAYLHVLLTDPPDRQTIRDLSVAIWSLTMGVMFLTGAFGLWSIRSTVEIEGRRRIGRFVAAMDYISDGLLLLDREGRVTGYNPALLQLLPKHIRELKNRRLMEVFPCVNQAQLECLLDLAAPREFECDCFYDGALHTLRFRSQPSSGVRLVLLSDVTDLRSLEMRQRQIALLQLVGRIAGGVAHDFNNILCAISGHAALLARGGLTGNAGVNSLEVIQAQTQKGALLSRQLLALSHAGMNGRPGTRVERHLEEAVALLRIALTPAWTVKFSAAGDCPPVPLTAGQIEQVVLNLGLLAADAQAHPGILTITLSRRGAGTLANVPERFAVVMVITAEPAPDGTAAAAGAGAAGIPAIAGPDDGGVILSVVKSLVEEAQGALELLKASSGFCVYRVCLPHLALSELELDADAEYPVEFRDYLNGWHLILANAGQNEPAGLTQALRGAGVILERRESMMAVLGGVEALQTHDVLIVDIRLLAAEMSGLLKALLKLCPRLGVVVMCPDPEDPQFAPLKSSVVFAGYAEPVGRMMQLLIIAKALRVSGKSLPQ